MNKILPYFRGFYGQGGLLTHNWNKELLKGPAIHNLSIHNLIDTDKKKITTRVAHFANTWFDHAGAPLYSPYTSSLRRNEAYIIHNQNDDFGKKVAARLAQCVKACFGQIFRCFYSFKS